MRGIDQDASSPAQMDFFWSAPPVTRTLTALTFIQSVLVYGGFLHVYYVIFQPNLIFNLPPELWRLVSPFLLTGPQLSLVFDLYFLFTYGSALETRSSRFSVPGDFLVYLLFIGIVISIAAGIILGNVIFTPALIMAFVYTWAQDYRGTRATLFMFNIPAELLPYALLLLTFLLSGWSAVLCNSTGIVAAHLYHFLTDLYPTFGGGNRYITTPVFVQRLFEPRVQGGYSRSYGRAYQQTQQPQRDSRPDRWPSFGNTWNNRGVGRRLGGD